MQSGQDRAMAKNKIDLWTIKLVIETNDEAVVAGISDAIAGLLCPDGVSQDHRCDPPWMIVRSPVRRKKAKSWRQLLNR
jgi:hypothetical protein